MAPHAHDDPPAAAPAEEREPLPVFDGAELRAEFVTALPELAVEWQAAPAPRPEVLALNEPLAHDLGLDRARLRDEDGVAFLVGRGLARGSRPAAQLYAGHQFGSYSPMLGDGRALLLGELRGPDGRLVDLHLKGSGRTPPARGDGFAAVGPMLREYLVSEAMHALGIPTTRALAVVATGRGVWRDDFRRDNRLPGAVLARVASSHLRVGTFQLARATRDAELLRRLLRFAIDRHAPQLAGSGAPARELLATVVERQAKLVAAWALVGFVHGVMNTDNMTISGETIDFGPCAFLDTFDPNAVFSSIDHEGRYRFANQPAIAKWNLARFAETLLPLIDAELGGDETATPSDAAVATATEALAEFDEHFDRAWTAGMRRKLGLEASTASREEVAELAREFLTHLQATGADYTASFRDLAGAAREGAVAAVAPAGWIARWRALGPDPAAMNRENPLYLPRNRALDAALEAATDGDLGPFRDLLAFVTSPYEERPGGEALARPEPAGDRFVTYCGT